MNLHQKLVEIKKSIAGFTKDVEGFGYSYVSGSQVLRAIKNKMDELGVLLIPEIDYSTFNWEKHEYTTVKGQEKLDFIITSKMIYTWVNADDPTDFITVPWVCVGQQTDDISKAIGTAMTYNERYFLLKQLGLPTDEADADAKKPTETTRANNKNGLSDAQVKRLYAIAFKSGYDNNTIQTMVFKRFNKNIKDLSKGEYDTVCNTLEANNK